MTSQSRDLKKHHPWAATDMHQSAFALNMNSAHDQPLSCDIFTVCLIGTDRKLVWPHGQSLLRSNIGNANLPYRAFAITHIASSCGIVYMSRALASYECYINSNQPTRLYRDLQIHLEALGHIPPRVQSNSEPHGPASPHRKNFKKALGSATCTRIFFFHGQLAV